MGVFLMTGVGFVLSLVMVMMWYGLYLMFGVGYSYDAANGLIIVITGVSFLASCVIAFMWG